MVCRDACEEALGIRGHLVKLLEPLLSHGGLHGQQQRLPKVAQQWLPGARRREAE